MMLSLTAMIRKEFRQVFRDPRTLGILLFVPLLLLVLFGYAISMDVNTLTVGVVDEDRSPESRRIRQLFSVLDLFEDGGLSVSAAAADAEEALVDGRLDAAVILPVNFGRNLAAGRTPEIQVLVDGSNITVASSALSSIEAALTDLSVRFAGEWRVSLPTAGMDRQPPLQFLPRTWYNPELRSTVFLVPGLISFIMVITAVISTALSVVREKERGTLELLEASPLPPVALILGKTIPYMMISLAETGLILFAGRILFGVSIAGNLFLLSLVTLLFLLSCLGIGLIISTIAETQQTAFLIATVATVLPSFILSGFVFPIRNMPLPVQAVTLVIPARYFLVAERAIIIRGAGIQSVWPQILILFLFSLLTLGISSVRLSLGRRKR